MRDSVIPEIPACDWQGPGRYMITRKEGAPPLGFDAQNERDFESGAFQLLRALRFAVLVSGADPSEMRFMYIPTPESSEE